MPQTFAKLQPGPTQSDWPLYGLVDDIRPALRGLLARGEMGALVTLVDVDGPSPRPLGAQMLIDSTGHALGYVSGGCVEGSLVLLARDVMQSGQARTLVFGADSPFMDVTLICGTQIIVLIEPVYPSDPSLLDMLAACADRRAFVRTSAPDQNGKTYRQAYTPPHRLIVLGADPVAIACVQLADATGLDAVLVRAKGPETGFEHQAARYLSLDADKAFALLKLDIWTAIVTTTHDLDQDHEALVAGLASDAFYVGALGSKRRLADRHAKLKTSGLSPGQIARLRAPVGLSIGAATPYEIAISILADIIKARRIGGST